MQFIRCLSLIPPFLYFSIIESTSFQMAPTTHKTNKTKAVVCHQSTSLVVDGNNPDIPVTQCKMGQIAPNFQVILKI